VVVRHNPDQAPDRPKADPSISDGLTRTQAEAELRKMIGAIGPGAARAERVTIAEAGELLVERTHAMGRKRASVETYESCVRVQLSPFFGKPLARQAGSPHDRAVHRPHGSYRPLAEDDAQRVGILHSIFEHARREGWVAANPGTLVDKPRVESSNPDIRFLEPEEIEALLEACQTPTSGASSGACT
jgi:hypothetical protein